MRRFTLGRRLESVLIEVLVEAAYSKEKQTPLKRTNLRLGVASRNPIQQGQQGGIFEYSTRRACNTA